MEHCCSSLFGISSQSLVVALWLGVLLFLAESLEGDMEDMEALTQSTIAHMDKSLGMALVSFIIIFIFESDIQ